MKSVNVQHNDIKIGEILVDENKMVGVLSIIN